MENMFYDELHEYFEANGIGCGTVSVLGMPVLEVKFASAGSYGLLYVIPAEIRSSSPEEAEEEYRARAAVKAALKASESSAGRNVRAVTVAEDLWRSRPELFRARLLSHTGRFRSIFARNCEVRRIDRLSANAFLDENHNYGAASCRYCFGLFEKGASDPAAVAAFSNARRWIKDGREIRSYEWVRYASASGVRIPGGMGKILARFTEEIRPDDIMSYADLEWSDGSVYRQLGFSEDGFRKPVHFTVDPGDWRRKPCSALSSGSLWYMNEGSLKYRLKVSGYRDRVLR